MNRAERITTTETRFLNVYIPMHVRLLLAEDDDEWAELTAQLTGSELRFGWTIPYDDPDSSSGVGMAFYVSRIVDQSLHLDDETFEDYVTLIEFQLNNHITLYDDFDPEERQRIVDNLLYDAGPGSMQLLNDVQLAVIEQQSQ